MASKELSEIVEDVKRTYGFSDQAWKMFSEIEGRNMDLGKEVSVLRDIARRSAVLVRWFSREDWPHVVFSDDETGALDRDAKSLVDALQRAAYYSEGWGE